MNSDQKQLRERLAKLDIDDLVRMATSEADQYTTAALQVAATELRQRGYSGPIETMGGDAHPEAKVDILDNADLAGLFFLVIWFGLIGVFVLWLVSPRAGWLGLDALLLITWLLGRSSDSTQTVNGIGATLYGRAETPQGLVRTKWIVFAFVPVLPVRSYIVSGEGAAHARFSGVGYSMSTTFNSRRFGGSGFYWPQVAKTATLGWSVIAAAWFLIGMIPR